jgi:hypothetical protein
MLRLMLTLLACLLGFGCGKHAPSPQAEVSTTTNESTVAVVAEPDMTSVLADLTQALRRYSAEKREVPPSLDALVAAGYIQQVPQAPAGKAFAVDRKDVRVVLR